MYKFRILLKVSYLHVSFSGLRAHSFAIVYFVIIWFLFGGFLLPLCVWDTLRYLSLVVRKPVFGVSDQVRHKPGCTATEDAKRLEISHVGSRGIVLSK